jgi:hypothetical protein
MIVFPVLSQSKINSSKPTIKTIKMVNSYGDTGTYTGPVVNGKANGVGSFVSKNGATYEGGFKNGLRNGPGTYIQPDGGKYMGNFTNDRCNDANATMVYSDGSRYEGGFREGVRNGLGLLIYSDGTRYYGNFVNDNQQGQAVVNYKDGSKYVGDIQMGHAKRFGSTCGLPTGFGALYKPNGRVDVGTFESKWTTSGYIWYPKDCITKSTNRSEGKKCCYPVLVKWDENAQTASYNSEGNTFNVCWKYNKNKSRYDISDCGYGDVGTYCMNGDILFWDTKFGEAPDLRSAIILALKNSYCR